MDESKKKNGFRESDLDIIASKAIKAGKRIYYMDVKKNRRDECNTVRVVVDFAKIVLLDVDGFHRTLGIAHTAVDTASGVDIGHTVTYSYGLGRAYFHTVRTANALLPIDIERVIKSLFHLLSCYVFCIVKS